MNKIIEVIVTGILSGELVEIPLSLPASSKQSMKTNKLRNKKSSSLTSLLSAINHLIPSTSMTVLKLVLEQIIQIFYSLECQDEASAISKFLPDIAITLTQLQREVVSLKLLMDSNPYVASMISANASLCIHGIQLLYVISHQLQL